MNFIEAVKLLDEEDSNGKRIYITRPCYRYNHRPYVFSYGSSIYKTNQRDNYKNQYSVFYSPSMESILANDWEIIFERKLYSFEEALEAFKEGKSIRRNSDKNSNYRGFSWEVSFQVKDIEAEDWIIE